MNQTETNPAMRTFTDSTSVPNNKCLASNQVNRSYWHESWHDGSSTVCQWPVRQSLTVVWGSILIKMIVIINYNNKPSWFTKLTVSYYWTMQLTELNEWSVEFNCLSASQSFLLGQSSPVHSDDQCDTSMDCTPVSHPGSLTTIDKVKGKHWLMWISYCYCYCEWMNGSIDHNDLDQWWFQCRWTRISSITTQPLHLPNTMSVNR